MFNLYSLCFDQDVLVPSLMEKGIEFSSNTLSMAPGIPIKPMLAKYINYCVFVFISLLLYCTSSCCFFPDGAISYTLSIFAYDRITNGAPQVMKLFQNKAFTCEYK